MSEWIKITDRWPEKWSLVLAYHEDMGTEIMKFDGMRFYMWGAQERDDAIDWYPINGVTHWMPLPKDPK